MVVDGGSYSSGDYANTVNGTDISYSRWECETMIGRSQEYSFRTLKETRRRAPFE